MAIADRNIMATSAAGKGESPLGKVRTPNHTHLAFVKQFEHLLQRNAVLRLTTMLVCAHCTFVSILQRKQQ
jgi:hypothetical protein